ncbi:MAG: BREX-3 system P-loop-containing protein BrxF [Acidobacteriota bacterium]
MTDRLVEQIILSIAQAAELYHRLVVLAAPAGGGKTAALHHVQKRTVAPLVNVNLELSRRMLALTQRQRTLQLPRILAELVGQTSADVVLLDNIEVLFDVDLKQDPLRLLKGLSRNRTLVVAWNGSIDDEYMTYASPTHREYRRYRLGDFLVVT